MKLFFLAITLTLALTCHGSWLHQGSYWTNTVPGNGILEIQIPPAALSTVPVLPGTGTTTTTNAGVVTVSASTYVLDFYQGASFGPAAASTYYYGWIPNTVPTTTLAFTNSASSIPISGVIKAVSFDSQIGTLGTAGQWFTNYIQIVNASSTNLVGTYSIDGGLTVMHTNLTGLSQAVTAGDLIGVKIITPNTWTSPATGIRLHARVYIEAR